jgi:hypothetical protein
VKSEKTIVFGRPQQGSELDRWDILRHLFLIALSALLVGCGPDDRKSPADLSESYAFEFGTPPPGGVAVVHARIMGRRDWSAHWLQFHAESDLIDSVILKGFTKQTFAPQGFQSPKDRYTPDWWILPPSEHLEYYTCNDWMRGGFSSSFAGIALHRPTGMIFFRCDKID